MPISPDKIRELKNGGSAKELSKKNAGDAYLGSF
jgi:hypothetical protein